MTKKQIIQASRDGDLILTSEGFFIDGVNVTKQMDKIAKLKFKDFENAYLSDVWSYYVRGFQLSDLSLCSIPNFKSYDRYW